MKNNSKPAKDDPNSVTLGDVAACVGRIVFWRGPGIVLLGAVLGFAVVEYFDSRRSTRKNPGTTSGRQTAHGARKILLPPFDSTEMTELAETLRSAIIPGSPNVKWESIKGLENAKCLIREAIVMPIAYPRTFTGCLSPWKGILLFGPQGTGKSMLAKAVATECKATFFNFSAASIFGKWRGEGGEIVKILFELARHNAPSVIFFDEIDSIVSQRGELCTEHESCQCVKIELLTQMDRLRKTNKLVFVIAATNLPWDVGTTMLQCFGKRILIPLPGPEARRAMFEETLGSRVPAGEAKVLFDFLAETTNGYSGSDINVACSEAAKWPLRRLMADVKAMQELVPENELPKAGPVTPTDIVGALNITKPSTTRLDAHRYEMFNQDYGS